MISVLFVDDEPNLRAALQRMFRSRRDRWSMRFAASGAEALEMIRSEPVDVVVSDMQMPEMNGAELLSKIKQEFPETILVILSGQCDRRTALTTVDPAHLHLSKPCDSTMMINAIERAYRLRSLLIGSRVERREEEDRSIGVSPVYPELVRMLRDPDVEIEAVAELIARDGNLTIKVLQLVNTAFFGTSWRIGNPLEAIKLLGLDLVRSLVLDIARSVRPPSSAGGPEHTIGDSLVVVHPAETGIVLVGVADKFQVGFANDAYRRLSGRSFEEIMGRPCDLLRGAGSDPQILRLAAEGHDVRTTIWTQRADGTNFWSDLSVTPLIDGSGGLAYHLCAQTELGADAAAACGAHGREPAIAFDQNGEGVLVLDRDGAIMAVNGAFEDMFGYSPAEAVGKTLDFIRSPLHGGEFYAERARTIEETGYWHGEVWHRLKDGLSVPHLVTITLVYGRDGLDPHSVVTSRTLVKKRDLERLRFLSNRDFLTGLQIRTLFAEGVTAAIGRARRSGARLAVLALYIDRFKLVNDSLGVSAGDQILQTTATRLQDFIGERGLAGSSGRGEFLLLVEDLPEDDEADGVVKEVTSALSRPVDIDGQEISVNVSVGFSSFPGDSDDASRLIGNAQAALLGPGEGSISSSRRYTREMNIDSVVRFDLANRLRTALVRDELMLHYQPKVSSTTGRITGLEALARWHHPVEGFVSPARFIPIAEETGLIEVIGEWIFKTACAQMRAWQLEGIAPNRIAVNLSPHQFRQADLLKRIDAVLAETGLDPHSLEMEITESSTMSHPEAAIRVMTALSDMGITLAMDDFGTGHSSLAYLKRFPINSLKIDQSFVRGLPFDPTDVAITEAIVALAKTLRLRLVAEGVETLEQSTFLTERGCEEMQGYLFSKPRNAAEIESLLRSDSLAAPPIHTLVASAQRTPAHSMA